MFAYFVHSFCYILDKKLSNDYFQTEFFVNHDVPKWAKKYIILKTAYYKAIVY